MNKLLPTAALLTALAISPPLHAADTSTEAATEDTSHTCIELREEERARILSIIAWVSSQRPLLNPNYTDELSCIARATRSEITEMQISSFKESQNNVRREQLNRMYADKRVILKIADFKNKVIYIQEDFELLTKNPNHYHIMLSLITYSLYINSQKTLENMAPEAIKALNADIGKMMPLFIKYMRFIDGLLPNSEGSQPQKNTPSTMPSA